MPLTKTLSAFIFILEFCGAILVSIEAPAIFSNTHTQTECRMQLYKYRFSAFMNQFVVKEQLMITFNDPVSCFYCYVPYGRKFLLPYVSPSFLQPHIIFSITTYQGKPVRFSIWDFLCGISSTERYCHSLV